MPSIHEKRLPLQLLLSFYPESFERRFIAHYVAFYFRYAQASLVLGLILVFGDFIVDRIANPALQANLLRIELAIPILAVGLGFTCTPAARKNWQAVIAGFIVVLALCLFWILWRIDSEGGAGLKTWVGILNFTFLEFYCFVILGVQFRIALISGTLMLCAFEGALWLQHGQSASVLAYWSYHVVTLFILAAGIGWWREFVLRKDFLARDALEDARQAAERLARSKSEFLATMSHEIRTPMNGVLGMTELLLDSALLPQQRAWAENVQVSGRHLLSVLNDVLDVSRMESGRLVLEAVDFDLRDVIQDVLSMFDQPARAKNLELRGQSKPTDAALPLHGDPFRLRQIVVNLVGNAIKFTEHGHVQVHAELVPSADGLVRVQISVSDTGIGIAPEAHQRIFERFSQADNSTTRRFGGTGLGLAISRQLTELMGGHIDVESSPGQGARFVVELSLPVAQESVPATSISDMSAATMRITDEPVDERGKVEALSTPSQRQTHTQARIEALHGSILLVEDNPVNQSFAIAVLAKFGLTCELAENGAIAVEKVAARPFDLVLMDCQMPVMDGFRATAAIRQLPHGQPGVLPIIALTANTGPGDEAKCIDAGMDDYLAKPFTLTGLRAKLEQWLPRRTEDTAHRAASGGTADEDSIIDTSVVDMLLEIDTQGGTAVLHQVVESFLASADQGLRQIRTSVESEQYLAIVDTAHSLKSSAGNVGAMTLAGCYAELERCGSEHRLEQARGLLDRTDHEQARVVAELHRLLRKFV